MLSFVVHSCHRLADSDPECKGRVGLVLFSLFGRAGRFRDIGLKHSGALGDMVSCDIQECQERSPETKAGGQSGPSP